jgi:hypothetical protein
MMGISGDKLNMFHDLSLPSRIRMFFEPIDFTQYINDSALIEKFIPENLRVFQDQ